MLRFAPLLLLLAAATQDKKPNVVLIITDDQGYGDIGIHGNDKIRTPHLDKLAKESFQFDAFHVSPVCSPTRSSLLTGRYTYRTGVVDTYMGRSMMHADEVTLAEMLGGAGYRTGIFGKWHLGDNYPLRATDQGFQESLTIRGGGLGQPSDPPGGDHYADATMYRNGKPVKTKGYCSDVYTDAAIDFVKAAKDKPFFAYVAYNAPHTPLEVPDGYLKPYKDAGLDDVTAKIYAMVTNIDDNVGRLAKAIDEAGVARDTIFIFMTDNGPQQQRYNAGMRALKGTVYEGGIRVPFFFRWPALPSPPRKVAVNSAHIDVVPTLLEACRVEKPAGVKMDGMSLLPFVAAQEPPAPGRTLFFQWHRGDVGEKFKACAAHDGRWKLVWPLTKAPPQLFDLHIDPAEKKDLATEHPEVVLRMTKAYEAWFEDVKKTREFEPPRIVLGTPHEDPVLLTRQDRRGSTPERTQSSTGVWLVELQKEAKFDVSLYLKAPGAAGTVAYACGSAKASGPVESGKTTVTLRGVVHPPGRHELTGIVAADGKEYGVDYVELKRVD
jgi:arylsulfatase A-like enzyme